MRKHYALRSLSFAFVALALFVVYVPLAGAVGLVNGGVVAGAISVPGEEDSYTFTATTVYGQCGEDVQIRDHWYRAFISTNGSTLARSLSLGWAEKPAASPLPVGTNTDGWSTAPATVPTTASRHESPDGVGHGEQTSTVSEAQVKHMLHGLHIPFIKNANQGDERVAYYAQTFVGTMFVTRQGQLVYALSGPAQDGPRVAVRAGATLRPHQRAPGWTVVETFVDAQPILHPGVASSTTVSRFVGTDRSQWQDRLSTYQSVRLGEVWPGIAVELFAYGNTVEKLFTLAPGVTAERIRVQIEGAQHSSLTDAGSLRIDTGLGAVELSTPIAWQEHNGTRQPVTVAYTLDDNRYGFTLGAYDSTLPVLIDPILQSTYLGGTGADLAFALAVTATDVYVAGDTASPVFPGTTGGAQAMPLGGSEAFVARLNRTLTSLTQATYLGGGSPDGATTLAVTATDVYVAGTTQSTDFPGTTGGAQSAHGGGVDAFVARLNLALTSLTQATYLGGSHAEGGLSKLGLAVTATDVYIAGHTASTNFPGTTGGLQPGLNGTQDAFVARLDLTLTNLLQATYLGGDFVDYASALAVTATDVYIAGSTFDFVASFPGTTGGAQPAPSGFIDAFVARLNLGLTSLIQATYLGGSNFDYAFALVVTGTGVYVAGDTQSTNFPGTAGGAQPALGGGRDAFVARLNLSLTSLTQATYLGGSGEDGDTDSWSFFLALAVTGTDVYVAGDTQSTNFPGTTGGVQPTNGGGLDAFVARLNLDLTSLVQATYLGGSGEDRGTALTVTESEVYVAGLSASPTFPGTTGGAQATNGGGLDAFVVRLRAFS